MTAIVILQCLQSCIGMDITGEAEFQLHQWFVDLRAVGEKGREILGQHRRAGRGLVTSNSVHHQGSV